MFRALPASQLLAVCDRQLCEAISVHAWPSCLMQAFCELFRNLHACLTPCCLQVVEAAKIANAHDFISRQGTCNLCM